MLEFHFPDIYETGEITHKQLTKIHVHFMDLRDVDKKYKVGWPIWLISNNAMQRGVYKIPRPGEPVLEKKEETDYDRFVANM